MNNKFLTSIIAMLCSMFGMDKNATVEEIHQRLADEETLIKAAVKDAQAETRLQVEGESEEQIAQLNARIADLEAANTDLQTKLNTANAQIETLSNEPDGEQAAGETEPPKGAKKKEAYLNEGTNAEVQAMLDNKAKQNNPFAGW